MAKKKQTILNEIIERLGDEQRALRFLERRIAGARASRKSGRHLAQLLSAKAQLLKQTKQELKGRSAALEAVVAEPRDQEALSILREFNPPADRRTRAHLLSVGGEAPIMSVYGGRVCFSAGYEVLANSAREALEFVREIQVVADPKTLKIIECQRGPRVPNGERKGVSEVYPSYSWEEIDDPRLLGIDDLELPDMSQVH